MVISPSISLDTICCFSAGDDSAKAHHRREAQRREYLDIFLAVLLRRYGCKTAANTWVKHYVVVDLGYRTSFRKASLLSKVLRSDVVVFDELSGIQWRCIGRRF